MDNTLQEIQTLQFTDRGRAETLLREFLREVFAFNVVSVELRPQPVSLNSFNGFLLLEDGRRLFFKTHIEQDNVIGEYYNARMLADAGYPVLLPLHSSRQAGKHLLIYEAVEDPSVFDLAWQIESAGSPSAEALIRAQHTADDLLLEYYLRTLELQKAGQNSRAPIHQLFYHRLTGGRLERFYGPSAGQPPQAAAISLPGGDYALGRVRRVRWVINGQEYSESLDQIILRAIRLLDPAQPGPSIIGHGDAHNGNVFFRPHAQPPDLLYYDPAFAGRHHPLLDLAKPIFHNVFAMWMYFPQAKGAETALTLRTDSDIWHVTHNYSLHPVREMFLESKAQRVLLPVLRELERHNWLRPDWRAYLKAALFCCPLLTMNLADSSRFPPEISLLGLAMAVEMGAESRGQRSRIDSLLDDVARQLSGSTD